MQATEIGIVGVVQVMEGPTIMEIMTIGKTVIGSVIIDINSTSMAIMMEEEEATTKN